MHNQNRVIVAIDLGSSSIRASAFSLVEADNDLNVVEAISGTSTSSPLALVEPNTGRIKLYLERDKKDETVFDAIDQCVDETLVKLRARLGRLAFEVVGVSFSNFVMNLLGVDEEGTVIGPEASISYACNSPDIAEEVATIRKQIGEENVRIHYQKSGCFLHEGYALAQLRVFYNRSVKNVCPEVTKWQTLASICLCRWLDQKSFPISYSEASWTGMLNYRTCEYEPDILNLLPNCCRRALPELADFDEPITLQKGIPSSSTYACRWPELRHARFFLGVGDGACANIGSKCSTMDQIACTVGTSAAARVCIPMEIGAADFKILPGLFCYRVDRHRVLVGGALTDGGSVVEWARQMLNIKESGAFDECMHKVSMLLDARYIQSASEDASFARTLTVVPFLSGERSTGFRGGATGAILGMTRDTTPAHVLLGCIEGVTLRMNAIIALIRQATEGDRKQRLIASGKALEVNELWRQMIADCSGLVCRFRYGNIGGNKSRSSVLGCGIIGILKGNINSGFARAIHNVGRVDTGSKRSCILEAGDYISGSFD